MMKRNKVLILVLSLFLSGSVLLSLWLCRPPSPLGADLDGTLFSAERAATHLKTVAQKPHPIGTAEHARVREYIVSCMKNLGYETEVQSSSILIPYGGHLTGGRIANVVARLPGSQGERGILVVGHYDTQPNTPGAADDGTAVVAMLEAARALRMSGGMKNDLIFLFSDAEEIGLVGAEAFVREHPLAKKVALVLNLEARGNRGVSFTFETSSENGWIMAEFAKAVKYPFAGSVMYEIYKRMPNNTDFTVFKNAGYGGFNAAFVDGFVHYHAMTDTEINLNRGSLQHQGEYIIDFARHFGKQDLSDIKETDQVFFNPAGSWLVVMPRGWQTLMLGGVLLLLCLAVFLAIRHRRLRPGSLLGGIAAYPLIFGLSLGVMQLLKMVYVRIYPQTSRYYALNMPGSGYFLLGFALLALLIFAALYWLMRKKLSMEALSIGALIDLTLLSVGLYFFMPTGAYALLYPLLLPVLIWTLMMGFDSDGYRVMTVLIFLSLIPAIFFLTPLVNMMFVVFSMGMMPAAVALLLVFSGILLPWICILTDRVPGSLALSLILVVGSLFFIGHRHSLPSTAAPMHSNLCYWLDADSGRALWASRHPQTDKGNRSYFPDPTFGPLSELFVHARRPYLKNLAPLADLPSLAWSRIEESFDETGRRIVSGRVHSQRGAPVMQMLIDSSPSLLGLEIEGRKVVLPDEGMDSLSVTYHNLPSDGIGLRLILAPGQSYDMVVLDLSWGLPSFREVQPFPEDIVPDTAFFSRATIVKRTLRL